jgi:hypothetical protein
MPADGTTTAAKRRDFGTSRWQLSKRLHHLPVRAEGAGVCLLLARLGPAGMSAMWSLSGEKRTLRSVRNFLSLLIVVNSRPDLFVMLPQQRTFSWRIPPCFK